MRLKNFDLIIALFVVGLNIAWMQVPYHVLIVNIIIALPLIFFLSGYTLTQILFRGQLSKQSPGTSGDFTLRPSLQVVRPLGSADQVVLSLGLSMAIDVLVGFALNILPMGLQGSSWVLALGSLTALFALLAAFFRRKDSTKDAKAPGVRITLQDSILFGLVILVTILSFWFSITKPLQPQSGFTQFWMLPSKQANNTCAILLGVHSNEATPVTYRVVMTINGVQVATWSSIVLAPQKEWDQSVPVKPESINTLNVQALLYRVDKMQTVYREVHVTLNSSGGNKDRRVLC